MKRKNLYFRSVVSCLVTIWLIAAHSLTALALPDDGLRAARRSGVLVVKGKATLNGKLIKTGGTLLSGNTVATSADGFVIVELGDLGRVSLGPNTTATINFSATGLLVNVTCDDLGVSLRRGECLVRDTRTGETTTLKAPQDEHFGSNVEVSATTADVVINCGRDDVPISPVILSKSTLWPLFLLLGGVGGVTGTLYTGGAKRRVSETRPLG